MLLLYISAHLYVVFLENERALDYLYLQLHVYEWRTEPRVVCLCFTFIPHCVSTVLLSVSLTSRGKTAACVRLCASAWMPVVQLTPHCQILSLVFSLMF